MKLKLIVSLLIVCNISSFVHWSSANIFKTRNKLLETNDILHATSNKPTSNSNSNNNNNSKNKLSPVILLPGDGGSRLQARLNRHDVAHKYCERKSNDWFDLWLNLSLLVPFALDCWVDKYVF